METLIGVIPGRWSTEIANDPLAVGAAEFAAADVCAVAAGETQPRFQLQTEGWREVTELKVTATTNGAVLGAEQRAT